jgi:hypothetical protein
MGLNIPGRFDHLVRSALRVGDFTQYHTPVETGLGISKRALGDLDVSV